MLLPAGPGSGKTVLLADWALAQNAPVGWINLTAADAPPRRFWLLLCSALRACTGLDAFASAVTADPQNDVVHSLLDSIPGLAVSPVLVIASGRDRRAGSDHPQPPAVAFGACRTQ